MNIYVTPLSSSFYIVPVPRTFSVRFYLISATCILVFNANCSNTFHLYTQKSALQSFSFGTFYPGLVRQSGVF